MFSGFSSSVVTSLTVALVIATGKGGAAFQSTGTPFSAGSGKQLSKFHRNQNQGYALEGAVESIDAFYKTEPFLAAFMTCSVKASAADLLAQTSATTKEEEAATVEQSSAEPETIDVDRNLAFWIYGGLYQGMFLQFLYTILFPFLYGDSPYQVPLQVATDILFFGPFITLPIAYVIKSFLQAHSASDSESISFSQSIENGINKYKNHVQTQGLLYKYWGIWGPAQTLNFGFVPEHLRVVFVAFVSFFWVALLSSISSQGETTTGEESQ